MNHRLRLLSLLALAIITLQGCAVLFVAGSAATAVALHDRRDLSTQVEDTGIELAINNALFKEKGLSDQARVRVFSVNNQVLLVGQVPSHELKATVDAIAKKQKGVKRVFNELEVAAPIPVSMRTEDSWISAKVRADLLTHKEVDFARVKVITEKQRIYLMGVVTPDEASKAVEITRNVPGVKEVIRVFDMVQ